jgi:uncharacterized membrane protein
MLTRVLFLLTLVSSLGAGLVGGVFFGFSTFVMPAMSRLPPAQGVAAMQAIDVAAVGSRAFMVALVGTALTSGVVAVASLLRWHQPGSGWCLAGGLIYVAGTLGVTVACNVPRNEALAKLPAASPEAATLWARYLVEWTAWNHVRAAAGLVAAALLLIALLRARW